MSNILFSFEDLAKGGAMNAVKRAFKKYNLEPTIIEALPSVKRTNGVSYRELALTWADSQQVILRIKQSGDIFQVLVNGKLFPIKHQDDHTRAVREIVDALDAKRAAFQKALAARKTKLPPSIRTAAPKMLETLTQRRDDLVVLRDGLREQLAEITVQGVQP